MGKCGCMRDGHYIEVGVGLVDYLTALRLDKTALKKLTLAEILGIQVRY